MRSTTRSTLTAGDSVTSLFASQVQDALEHLYDHNYLRNHVLARRLLPAAPPSDEGPLKRGAPGQALRQVLLDAIEAMRPAPQIPADARVSRAYRLLQLRYADAKDTREVREQLAIGRSEYYREQRRALDGIAALLQERYGSTDEPVEPAGPNESAEHAALTSSATPAAPTSLPSPPGAFIGREEELAQLAGMVVEHRLVTLTGAPGTGKTRLALEAARSLTAAFPDGVHFVPLSQVSDPQLVPSAITRSLGSIGGRRRGLQGVQSAIGNRSVLVLLDNFEQVLSAAPAIAELLEACPGLHLLATSRARLRVTAEHEFAVSSLPVPDSVPLSRERALEHAAVALFEDRAREVKPSFSVTEENASTIVGICAQLDGLPLAIELAAARVRYLPPMQMLTRLDHGLAFLAGGARDRPIRQQTIRGAIDWSYRLLTPEERDLFSRLAVFRGGWTLEAVEALYKRTESGPPEIGSDLFDHLVGLVENSLVREDEDAEGGPRFDMLRTIQDFAQECLAQRTDRHRIHERHAAYYLEVAHQSSSLEGSMLDRLEREHDNLRAALDWLADQGDAQGLLDLTLALSEFWLIRGYYGEGLTRLGSALAINGVDARSPRRALALRRRGALALERGDLATARHDIEEALSVEEAIGDQSGVAHTLYHLMRLTAAEGRRTEARALGERSLAMLREMGDRPGTASVLMRLARIKNRDGEPDGALDLVEEAAALFRETGRHRMLALACCTLGFIAFDQGQLDDARRHFGDSAAVLATVRDPAVTAQLLEGVAGLASVDGRYTDALRLAGAADALRSAIGATLQAESRNALHARVSKAMASLSRAEQASASASGLGMEPLDALALARTVIGSG